MESNNAVERFLDECNGTREEEPSVRKVVRIEQTAFYDRIFYDDGTMTEYYIGD